MTNFTTKSTYQPMIVKYVEPSASPGIHSINLERYVIGYILRGTKFIYYGDKRYQISKGDVFYLGTGHHYFENQAEAEHPFEQIVFYYTPQQLQHTLLHLSMTYGMNFTERRINQDTTSPHGYLATMASNTMRSFFLNAASYLSDELFIHDQTAENIKMSELIYLILSREGSPMRSRLLSNMDTAKGNFEQTVYANIFCDRSIEELSEMTHRSLTSFKKEFKRLFNESPHKWYIRQRLMHSRLLLLSTSKSISEIGNECTFPNTSHFIKLFKREYGYTPSIYRNEHLTSHNLADRGSRYKSSEQTAAVMEMAL